MADIISMMAAAAGQGGEYEIKRSLRFNSADSAYLSRTPASASNRKTWTWSGWVKLSDVSTTNQTLFSAHTSTERTLFYWVNNIFVFEYYNGSTYPLDIVSSAVYRDPSAWYHIVVYMDTTQATNTNGCRLYVNGVSQALTYNPYTQDTTPNINMTVSHNIGRRSAGSDRYFSGYMTEINFIDGQALTPSSFGEFNPDTGVWQPKKYAGTYGTNGFYLNFSDNSGTTSTTLGKDYSGNGNNWTPNNFSVTAGAGNDSLVDSPTRYGTDTGAGGNVRGNYCTLNPLTLTGSGTGSVSDGNLVLTSPSNNGESAQLTGTIAVSSGKYYFEETFTTLTSASGYLCAGLWNAAIAPIPNFGGTTRAAGNSWWISDDGNYRANGGSLTSSGLGTFSAGDVAMIAVDMDNKIAWIGKNGVWVGDPAAGTGNTFSSLPISVVPFAQAIRNTTTSSVITANFGQRPFAYTAPSGFKALVTTNLPEGTITTSGTFTGNGSTNGPFVYLNGVPTAMTIGGNAVTFGTHADKLSNGFKIRSSSSTYNQNATTMSYSITSTGDKFKFALAQPNP